MCIFPAVRPEEQAAAQFTAGIGEAAKQPAVIDDSDREAGSDIDISQTACFAAHAPLHFRQSCGVHIIIHTDRQAIFFRQACAQIEGSRIAEEGAGNQPVFFRIDQPAHGDSDSQGLQTIRTAGGCQTIQNPAAGGKEKVQPVAGNRKSFCFQNPAVCTNHTA